MISPEPPYRLSPEQKNEAVDLTLKKLGLEGHPRVVVEHDNEDRGHIHVVVARIDLETMTAVPDSHNFRKHEEAARELERLFGHPRVQGAHAERDGVERPERSPSRAELRQEERTGIKAKDVKAEVTALFLASNGPQQFKDALEAGGYVLAKGDKRDFVIVDRGGGDHSLARRIDGMKAAALRDFMAPLDRNGLPTVEEAKGIVQDRMRAGSEFDRQCWEDALTANAIERAKADDIIRERNAKQGVEVDRQQDAAALAATQWDDALAANAIEKDQQLRAEQARRRGEWWESHKQALIEKAYGRGDDLVSQTQAAIKDDKRRQKALDNEQPRPHRPSERSEDEERIAGLLDDHDHDRRKAYDSLSTPKREDRASAASDNDQPRPQRPVERSEDEERIARLLDDHDRDRRKADDSGSTRKRDDRVSAAFENIEMTEAQQQRMERMLDTGDGEGAHSSERDDLEPDRQREAPGGGHTRSR
jgi:hypothetical protein